MVQLWWPFVRTDDVLFHVTLLLSSLSLERLKGHSTTPHTKQLLAECIRLLSQRVEDPVLGISDQTVVAVANLAAIEVRVQSHMIVERLADSCGVSSMKGEI